MFGFFENKTPQYHGPHRELAVNIASALSGNRNDIEINISIIGEQLEKFFFSNRKNGYSCYTLEHGTCVFHPRKKS